MRMWMRDVCVMRDYRLQRIVIDWSEGNTHQIDRIAHLHLLVRGSA